MLKKTTIACISLIAFCQVIFSCRNGEEPINAQLTSLTESVYASVAIEPEDLYRAYAAVNGIIKAVLVKEGDTIYKETPLVEITNNNPRLNLHNAKLALDLAKRNYEGRANVLNELKDEISIAQLQLENDSLNFIKQQNLWKKNIGTQSTYEARELAYLTAKSNYNLRVNRLHRTEQDLLTIFQEAQNNYKNAQNTDSDHTVKSRMDGRVYEVLKEAGEMVSQQEPIAIIGSAEQFVVEMDIDEIDITRVENGQRILISLDAYPNQVFNAFVSHIYPRKDMATQTFRVEARFLETPNKLFSGLSGEANIIIRQKENTLVIPRTYLTGDNKVKTDAGLVQVETGLQNLDKVEILSGIESTTNLYLPKK